MYEFSQDIAEILNEEGVQYVDISFKNKEDYRAPNHKISHYSQLLESDLESDLDEKSTTLLRHLFQQLIMWQGIR